MNREIKFRAWDKKQKRWANLQLSEMEFTRDGLLRVGETIEYGTHAEFNDFELMQYTGLKDADGVADIYEGDIIDMQGNIKGNIYESPQIYEEGIDCIVTGMGTDAWRNTESVAMGRGCFYAEQ